MKGDNEANEDFMHDRSTKPYVIWKFLGCDLVIDDDVVAQQASKANA